ncbi:MAG: thiolase family protein [Peptococcaceae bacterium]|nr:thiolase family protein [Peptococcaceae bacterium]
MQDAVIVDGNRTAVGMFGKTLRDVPASVLATHVLNDLVQRTGIPREAVDEVIFGNGYIHGGGLNIARIASQKAGFPRETPAYVIIKACASGLKAITSAAMAIKAGEAEVIIAGGAENMSQVPHLVRCRWGKKYGDMLIEDALMVDGLICALQNEHMGVTAERLARRYGISRNEQDEFAYQSHYKAVKAIERGAFEEEIVPLEVKKRKETVVFAEDESVRKDIDLEKMSKLPPVFQKNGTVMAGNACPMNDAASSVLVMSAEKAKEYNLNPKARVVASASVGVDPAIMGIGPVPATRKALQKAGLSLDDIALIELNEAFAAQSLAVIKELELDPQKVNVNGGAIALGHPVGATGPKLTITLINELIRRNERYGLVTLCMSGGLGMAVIFENLRYQEERG